MWQGGVLIYRWLQIGAGMILLLTVCLLSQWKMLPAPVQRTPRGTDSISLYVSRFDLLRQVLPKRATICYMASANADGMDYFLTEYALAPVVVANDGDCELWIGNSKNGQPLPQHTDLTLLRDFSTGVQLFKKRLE